MDAVCILVGAAFFLTAWRLVYAVGRLDGGAAK